MTGTLATAQLRASCPYALAYHGPICEHWRLKRDGVTVRVYTREDDARGIYIILRDAWLRDQGSAAQ